MIPTKSTVQQVIIMQRTDREFEIQPEILNRFKTYTGKNAANF